MHLFFISFLFFSFLSISNAEADEYISCHNCTATQAKSLAKQFGLELGGSMTETAHVFDVMQGLAWTFRVTSIYEPELDTTIIIAASVTVPIELTQATVAYKKFLEATAVKKYWSFPTKAASSAEDGPIIIPAETAGCAGSMLSDEGALAAVNLQVRAAMTGPLTDLFDLGSAPRNILNYLMDEEPIYVAVAFADGSSATFHLDSYMTHGGYEYVNGSARNSDGTAGGGDCDGDGENDNDTGDGSTGGSGGEDGGTSYREGTTNSETNSMSVCRTGYVNGVFAGHWCWTYYWP